MRGLAWAAAALLLAWCVSAGIVCIVASRTDDEEGL